VHTPVIWFAFVKLAPAPVVLKWAVLIALSAGLPVILYHSVEAPLINLGRLLAEGARKRTVPYERVASAAGGS
jgi:peptidoglycan/LPS O-acetylase OafA/YrhL